MPEGRVVSSDLGVGALLKHQDSGDISMAALHSLQIGTAKSGSVPRQRLTACLDVLESYKKKLDQIYTILIGVVSIVLFIILLRPYTDYNPLPVDYLPTNNWKFQVANSFLLLSYVGSDLLWLRVILATACAWYMIWAATFPPMMLMDTFLWNFVMMLINSRHAVLIFYSQRPLTFDVLHETLYKNLFEGLTTRDQFLRLTKTALIRDLGPGRKYCEFGDTCTSLACVISGSFIVYAKDKTSPTATITEFEFLDSPEWLTANVVNASKSLEEVQRFKVTLEATTQSRFMMWPRETLQETLAMNPDLRTPLLGILGVDVSKKVFLISEHRSDCPDVKIDNV